MDRTLIVIPARKGSKGLNRKHVRLLGDKPVLWWTFETVSKVTHDCDVWLSTNDDECALLARRWSNQHPDKPIHVLERPPKLCGDDVTLDPVVWHATQECEKRAMTTYDVVCCVQATSPFLEAATIDKAIAAVAGSKDYAFTARQNTHLCMDGRPDCPFPESGKWANRQQQVQRWDFVGAVTATARTELTPDSNRIGWPHLDDAQLIPMTGREAADLDTPEDWWVAEGYANRKRIAYRVDGGGDKGLGHVYRALALSNALVGHEVTFFMDASYPDGVRIVNQAGAVYYVTEDDWAQHVYEYQPDVLVWEGEDTGTVAIDMLTERIPLVVTVEDRGPGADAADLTFNDLDGPPMDGPQRFQGPKYAVLRDEFWSVQPREIRDTVEHVLLCFGGTDPNNYTQQTLTALDSVNYRGAITVVLGPGYMHEINGLPWGTDVEIITATDTISQYMERADLAVTSCGRTVYELAACGVFTIAIPQNENEKKHFECAIKVGAVPIFGLQPIHDLPDVLTTYMDPEKGAELRAYERERALTADIWHGAERFWSEVFDALREKERVRSRVSIGSRDGVLVET